MKLPFGYLFRTLKNSFNQGKFISIKKKEENEYSFIKKIEELIAKEKTSGRLDGDTIILNFYFYTNKLKKAQALKESLRLENYQAFISHQGDTLYLISGWTNPIIFNTVTLHSWVLNMNEMGFEKDCDFDGFNLKN